MAQTRAGPAPFLQILFLLSHYRTPERWLLIPLARAPGPRLRVRLIIIRRLTLFAVVNVGKLAFITIMADVACLG